MQGLLANPAIQAAIAPFIVALVIALMFRRMGAISLGLAIVAGFLTTVMLTTGLVLHPLTSTRKIILVSLCLPFLLLLIQFVLSKISGVNEQWRAGAIIAVPVFLLMAAIIWVIWPVLSRQELSDAWPMLVSVCLYVGVIGAAFLGLSRLKKPEKSAAQGASAVMLGLGTATTSMIAASALYAQLAFSIAAAVGCLLLMSVFKAPSLEDKYGVGYLGSFGLFAAAVPLALIAAAATVYAQLPAWVLLCLAGVPLLAAWPTINLSRPWLKLLAVSSLALLPVIPAVWFAWNAADSMSY